MDEKSLEKVLDKLLDKKLKPIKVELKLFSSTMLKIEESMEFLSNQYDDLITRIVNLEDEKIILTKEKEEMKRELNSMKNEVRQSSSGLNDLEQYSRRECLEIRGIPLPEHGMDKIPMKLLKSWRAY